MCYVVLRQPLCGPACLSDVVLRPAWSCVSPCVLCVVPRELCSQRDIPEMGCPGLCCPRNQEGSVCHNSCCTSVQSVCFTFATCSIDALASTCRHLPSSFAASLWDVALAPVAALCAHLLCMALPVQLCHTSSHLRSERGAAAPPAPHGLDMEPVHHARQCPDCLRPELGAPIMRVGKSIALTSPSIMPADLLIPSTSLPVICFCLPVHLHQLLGMLCLPVHPACPKPVHPACPSTLHALSPSVFLS